jgi:predicted kinase
MSNNDDDSLLAALRRLPPVQPTIGLRAEFAKRARLTSRRHVARWPLAIAAGLSLILGAGWWQERTAREAEVLALRTELEAAILDVSAARRLVAMNSVTRAGVADGAMITTLTRLALFDESPSVRIAAIEAITAVASVSELATVVNQSLAKEHSALVQSVLLQATSHLDAPERTRALDAFLSRRDLDPIVRADANSQRAT